MTITMAGVRPMRGFREPMLATALKDSDLSKLVFPRIVSPKIDGIRATWHGADLLTRSMKLVPNLFTQTMAAMLAEIGGDDLRGVDGELIVGDCNAPDVFNKTTSGVMTYGGQPDVTWHVFDRYEEPFEGRGGRSVARFFRPSAYEDRLEKLRGIVKKIEHPRLILVPHQIVNNVDELARYEDWSSSVGFEGVMLNSPRGLYKCGRSSLKSGELLKRKPFEDFEAVVTGTYEQERNNNESLTDERGRSKRSSHQDNKVGKGTLGGFYCKTLDGSGTEFKVGNGPGLTAQLRQDLWDCRDELPGKFLKLRKQKVGEVNKPRIPQYLGFRDDRDM